MQMYWFPLQRGGRTQASGPWNVLGALPGEALEQPLGPLPLPRGHPARGPGRGSRGPARGVPTHLRVFGDPVAEHVQDAVGGRSPDHELLVPVPLVRGKPCGTGDTGYRRTRNGARCSSGSKPWAGVSQATAVPAPAAFGLGVQCWPRPGAASPERPEGGRCPGLRPGCARRGSRPLPRTCAGQGHPAVLFLVRGSLVGSCRGDGKGRSRRQGAARTVQFPTRGHDDPVVVGEEGELCGGDGTDPQPSLGCQRTGGPHTGAAPRQPTRPHRSQGLAGGGGGPFPCSHPAGDKRPPQGGLGVGKAPTSPCLLHGAVPVCGSPSSCPVHGSALPPGARLARAAWGQHHELPYALGLFGMNT